MKNVLIILLVICWNISMSQEKRETRTVASIFLVCDTGETAPTPLAYRINGFIVQELHNTSEGVIDSGISKCIDDNGNRISCYYDYWVTVKYLDDKKKSLKNVIIWYSKILQ